MAGNLHIDKAVLSDQAEKFESSGIEVRTLVDDWSTWSMIEDLEQTGLGWDTNGRIFSLPYWNQQTQVIEALRKVIADFAAIHKGLLQLTVGSLTLTDDAVAALMKQLDSELPDTSRPLLPSASQTDPLLRRWPN